MYILWIAVTVAFVTLMLGLLSWTLKVEREARAERKAEREWRETMLRNTRNAIEQHAHRIAAGDAGRSVECHYQQLIRLQRAQLKDLDG